jgi:hypothetical protein
MENGTFYGHLEYMYCIQLAYFSPVFGKFYQEKSGNPCVATHHVRKIPLKCITKKWSFVR